MELHDIAPQCRVNLDYGNAFCVNDMRKQGIVNIPYAEGEMNIAAVLLGVMADTITILDDGKRSVKEKIDLATEIAPLAKRILIIRREGQGYRVYGKADAVCADRDQRQRQIYVC